MTLPRDWMRGGECGSEGRECVVVRGGDGRGGGEEGWIKQCEMRIWRGGKGREGEGRGEGKTRIEKGQEEEKGYEVKKVERDR